MSKRQISNRQVEEALFARGRAKEREEKLARYEMLLESTRAGGLLLKGQKFVAVAMDEPYYAQVYRLIRLHAKQRGKWTSECESEFQTAMQMWFDFHPGLLKA
jgi:hypothetical protein